MYVCGPTIYDHIHIGNARPIIFFDVVRNYLMSLGYKVRLISNVTDIDDKIINKALDEEVNEKEISSKYLKAFIKVLKKFNVGDMELVTVTESIESMGELIQDMIDNGYAYKSEGNVYFDVSKLNEYGKLSNIQNKGFTESTSSNKRNEEDFVLWKKTDKGLQFKSPFGEGRPGWHTECVSMINDKFGEMIDIHGGGDGLKFPHHENEIAQSLVVNNHRLATYWMHNGMVDMNGKKMSKSKGNVVYLKNTKMNPNAFRLFILSSYYKSPLAYNSNTTNEFNDMWDKIERTYIKLLFLLHVDDSLKVKDLVQLTDTGDSIKKMFNEHMNLDFNTPNAISELIRLTKYTNQSLRDKDGRRVLLSYYNVFDYMFKVFGLVPNTPAIFNSDVEIYELWVKARKEKDFSVADRCREILMGKKLI
jgi:cysteinyl-tRNA synthetase